MKRNTKANKKALKNFIEFMETKKMPIIAMASIVVMITTYSLILPAITITRDKAQEQGGISVAENVGSENGFDSDADKKAEKKADDKADKKDDSKADNKADSDNRDNKSEGSKEDKNTETKENKEDKQDKQDFDGESKKGSDKEKESDGKEESDGEEEPEESSEESDKEDIAGELTFKGTDYTVTASYRKDSGVPQGAGLDVKEISDESSKFDKYIARTETALGWSEGTSSYARLFDIKIVDKDGKKVRIKAPVDVEIRLSDKDTSKEAAGNTQVVHFADGEVTPDVIQDIDVSGKTVSFEAEGFSAYAIVEGPDPVPLGWNKVETIEDLKDMAEAGQGLYIGHVKGFYFKNTITKTSDNRIGITKTKPAQTSPASDAVKYYFEIADDDNDMFYVYCYSNDNEKQYVKNANNNSLSFTDDAGKTAFKVTVDDNGVFNLKNGNWYWNMQGGENGTRFCSYTTVGDVNNNMYFWYRDEITEDPYDLDGKTYGLMNWNGGAAGKALMGEPSKDDEHALESKVLTVLVKKHNNEDKLFVPNETEINMWTFHWVESDKYYVTTVQDGSTMYLKIDANGTSVVSSQDEASEVQVIPGTGVHAGQMCLKSGNNTLTYSGNIDSGFNTSGSTGSEWLYPVELTDDPTPEYIMTHSAKKISVSDPSLTTGSKIIVYTRFWNDDTKKYEFYAIDPDGNLVPCTEYGDSIEWVGGQLNELLWQFTEYTNEDGTPNYYYELYNEYSEKFIAPQVKGGQILSDNPIGINLNGRKDGKYYSSILAWDDRNYAYAGLKVKDGKIVSCPKSQSMDFYFAVMEDLQVDDKLHTVSTIDNNQYGIKMRIKDFDSRPQMKAFLGNDEGGVGTALVQGLLTTDLKDNGYPNATGGSMDSMANFFSGSKEVNHLFIESTYKASGYYEFDSSQNYASLDKNNNFKVYKEIASYDSVGSRPTLKHGQFFPFNDIEPGLFATVNGENLYSTTADLLPDGDPRKYEQLYLIKNVDCYFGVELEASFVQTPSGLDAWGHDIIYEFTGDDDFWLYVDGELVIDLGGIHSAVPGSVNFRTGQVNVNGNETTLRDLFYNNYLGRDGHTAADAQAYVDGIFEQNANGQWVFKDNTKHTMRIFYLERGAGASNLHMRFNLASIKPGTVLLSKDLSGVDSIEGVHAEFPYQIYYKYSWEDREYLMDNDTDDHDNPYVIYKDTENNAVSYRDHLTVAGVKYNNVFILKPDEVAEISFPTKVNPNTGEEENISEYRIVECGINTDVYDQVKVNNTAVTGSKEYSGSYTYQNNRKDFAIGYDTTDDRPSVAYDNHVNPDAKRELTIVKKLYDETGEHTAAHEVHNADATFSFRLYLATEYDGNLYETEANMHPYHVKNPAGEYCTWDADQEKFVSTGITDYDQIEDKVSITFHTSVYGSITKIPAYYTVEVRDVLAGTQYRVEERPWEIPDGYSFQEYDNYDTVNASIRERTDAEGRPTGVFGVDGTAVSGQDPNVDVCNLKGWGLRMNKVWSDKDYMDHRDPAYFAVFTGESERDLTLVPDTVRELKYDDAQTLYWYFQTLPVQGVSFDHYWIREVMLDDLTYPVVNADGYVTNYGTVTPVNNGSTITIRGQQKGESEPSGFEYTVLYRKGQISSDSNVRVDTVTNNRPGVELRKEDFAGHALAGATFELKDENGALIGTFTSDEDGLITVAFLRDDVEYTVTETKTPQGYQGILSDLKLTLHQRTISISGVDEEYYRVTPGETPILTIKNRPYSFRGIKIDKSTREPLQGVKFELHKQKTVDGVTIIDPNPMPGYEEMVTEEDGTIPGLDESLEPGVYELREKAPVGEYLPLSPDRFKIIISEVGEITRGNDLPDGVELNASLASNGGLGYVLTVPNSKAQKVSIWKTDTGHTALTGAWFELYKAEDYDDTAEQPIDGKRPVVSGPVGDNGILTLGELKTGEYRLVETTAPDGYDPLTSAVRISVRNDNTVTAIQSGNNSEVTRKGDQYWVAGQDKDTWQIRVWNNSGTELPMTGSLGTTWMYVLGVMLIVIGAIGIIIKRLLPVGA